jgi:hypothetical protein
LMSKGFDEQVAERIARDELARKQLEANIAANQDTRQFERDQFGFAQEQWRSGQPMREAELEDTRARTAHTRRMGDVEYGMSERQLNFARRMDELIGGLGGSPGTPAPTARDNPAEQSVLRRIRAGTMPAEGQQAYADGTRRTADWQMQSGQGGRGSQHDAMRRNLLQLAAMQGAHSGDTGAALQAIQQMDDIGSPMVQLRQQIGQAAEMNQMIDALKEQLGSQYEKLVETAKEGRPGWSLRSRSAGVVSAEHRLNAQKAQKKLLDQMRVLGVPPALQTRLMQRLLMEHGDVSADWIK